MLGLAITNFATTALSFKFFKIKKVFFLSV